MKDVTDRYLGMLEGIRDDFELAMEPDAGFCMDDPQCKIEEGDGKVLADIGLLKELSCGLRHGKIKITEGD